MVLLYKNGCVQSASNSSYDIHILLGKPSLLLVIHTNSTLVCLVIVPPKLNSGAIYGVPTSLNPLKDFLIPFFP